MDCSDIGIKEIYGDPAPTRIARFRRVARQAWKEKFGTNCPDCGCTMVFDVVVGGPGFCRMATLDHILARSLGGTDHLKNLRFVCRGCNQRKAVRESLLAKKGRERIFISEACHTPAPVAQMVEAADLKSAQGQFESDAAHQIFILKSALQRIANLPPLHQVGKPDPMLRAKRIAIVALGGDPAKFKEKNHVA